MSMTLTTAIEEVRARIQELTADFWTANEVNRAINEGVTRFAQEEKWPYLYTSKTGVTLTSGTATLDLEPDVNFERHFDLLMTLTGDTRLRRPQRVSPAEGTALRLRFTSSQSEPMAYYLYAETVTSGVYKAKVRFVPVLNRAATIEYTYVRNPTPVSTGSDKLDIPDQYVMGAIAYATGHLFLKELQFSQKADEQFALYRKVVDDAKREMRKLVIDKGFGWGRNQPEWGQVTTEQWVELVTPPTLGP